MAKRKAPTKAEPGAPVTIRDIAARLGISHTTVSRALGGNARISAGTRREVQSVADAMGYVPNASARAMRSARSTVVGLLIPDIQNDFYAQVAKVLSESLATRGMQLVLSVTEDDPERELRDVRALRVARASSVVIVPSPSPLPATLQLLAGTSAIQLGRSHAGIVSSAVLMDDFVGTHAATRHLLSLGHRRIGFVGGSEAFSSHRERLRGFREALSTAGVRSDGTLILTGPPRPEFGRHATQTLMKQRRRPTALVMGGSELTLGSLRGLAALSVRWPEDVSLVGYGDPAWFELGQGITTVRLPVREIADTVAKLMRRSEAEQRSAEGRLTVSTFAPILVLRASTRSLR